jgi:CBS domain-containing protein
MKITIVPDIIKDRKLVAMSTAATARAAAKLMAEAGTAAVVVMDDEKLVGIVTERDLTRRVLAVGKDPDTITLDVIMTRNPDILAPTDSALDALELMRVRRYRHVPVVDAGRVIGMVSIQDLYDAVKERLEEDMLDTTAFAFGND